MTILCSDKTGTLTLNKMVLQDVFLYEHGVDREKARARAASRLASPPASPRP